MYVSAEIDGQLLSSGLPSMVRKTKEDALITRDLLLDAAEDVFYREGYGRATLEMIACNAKMTRGAIYWHFNNKADIFNAMCERVRLPMEQLAGIELMSEFDDPLGHLRKLCVVFLTESVRNIHHRKVSEILFYKCELVDPLDPVYIRQREAFLSGRACLTKLIYQAIEKKQLPADLNVFLAAILFQASIEGVLKNWFLLKEELNLETAAESVVDACIDALRVVETLRKPLPS